MKSVVKHNMLKKADVVIWKSYPQGLSGTYLAILNISRNGRVVLMYLDSQSEEILLCIHNILLWG